jgi:hypothetical protein
MVNTGGEPLHPPVLVLHPRVQVHAQVHLVHPDEGAAGGRVAAWREVHDTFVLSPETGDFLKPSNIFTFLVRNAQESVQFIGRDTFLKFSTTDNFIVAFSHACILKEISDIMCKVPI